MKPLEQLMNTEKARLLHQLFPAEIPALLQFIQGMCITIAEQQETLRGQWDNGLFTFDTWLSFAGHTGEKITQYEKKLHTSSRLFADQLLDGLNACFLVHCLSQYTTTRQHANPKLAKAIDLLFFP